MTPDTGHRTQDARRKTQETGRKTQDAGHRKQDARHRTQDTGHNIGLQATSFKIAFHASRLTSVYSKLRAAIN